MATINYAYTPADAAVLNIPNFNGNIWSLVSGESLYGELNGYLNLSNFHTGETLEPGLVRRYDVCATAQKYNTDNQTVIDKLFANDGTASDSDANWIQLASCSVRCYLDKDYDQVLYGISCFLTALRQRYSIDGNPASADYDGPVIYYKMFVDGAGISHTRRPLPYSWWPGNNPNEAVSMTSREQVLCRHIDLVHLDVGATLKGWHSVDLRIYMPANTGVEYLTPPGKASHGTPSNEPVYNNSHRVTIGTPKAHIIGIG